MTSAKAMASLGDRGRRGTPAPWLTGSNASQGRSRFRCCAGVCRQRLPPLDDRHLPPSRFQGSAREAVRPAITTTCWMESRYQLPETELSAMMKRDKRSARAIENAHFFIKDQEGKMFLPIRHDFYYYPFLAR